MVWYPTFEYIKDAYEVLKLGYPQLEKHCLTNKNALKGIIDNLGYGLPIRQIKLDLWEKAGRFLREMITYSPFSDGNKRIAFIITYHFLNKNNYFLDASEDEKVNFTIFVAKNTGYDYKYLAKWLKSKCEKIKK